MPRQDLSEMATRKMKGFKRRLEEGEEGKLIKKTKKSSEEE